MNTIIPCTTEAKVIIDSRDKFGTRLKVQAWTIGQTGMMDAVVINDRGELQPARLVAGFKGYQE